MKKLTLMIAGLLISAPIFAGSFTCPKTSIDYRGNTPQLPGWAAGLTEDKIPSGTYYLASALSSSDQPTLAACFYSLTGKADAHGFPPAPGGIWVYGGSMSIAGEGQWVPIKITQGHNRLCRGTNCTFKTY